MISEPAKKKTTSHTIPLIRKNKKPNQPNRLSHTLRSFDFFSSLINSSCKVGCVNAGYGIP